MCLNQNVSIQLLTSSTHNVPYINVPYINVIVVVVIVIVLVMVITISSQAASQPTSQQAKYSASQPMPPRIMTSSNNRVAHDKEVATF